MVAGLRFPLSAALSEILAYSGLRITQVYPNSIRIVMGFLIYYRLYQIPYSLLLTFPLQGFFHAEGLFSWMILLLLPLLQ